MALRVPSKLEIGQRLRWLRKQAGMSGRALSLELTGKVDPSLTPEMEKGDRLGEIRLMELANIFAGKGDLVDDPGKILNFVYGLVAATELMHPRPLSLVPPVNEAENDGLESASPEPSTGR